MPASRRPRTTAFRRGAGLLLAGGLLLTTACSPAPVQPAAQPAADPATAVSATGSAAKAASQRAKKNAGKTTEKRERKSATSVKVRKPTGNRTIYLTFDDGPSSYTRRVLEALARYDAKATFFVLGQNVGSGALVRRAAREGHSIQNHTWNHPDLRTLSTKQIRSQVRRTDTAIRKAGGGRSTCVRPPYGATNAKVRGVLRDLGKRQSLWDVDTEDWRRPGSGAIYRRILRGAKTGVVVLAHDGGGNRAQTVRAVRRALATLTERGYEFGTLCR